MTTPPSTTSKYAHLDELFPLVKFKEPPIPCGLYTVKDDFDTEHKYHFRRMPRARKYTGRFGLWYHHPDAHWLLVGWVNDENQFQRPVDISKEYERFLDLFLLSKRTLTSQRCAWCGRTMPIDHPTVHGKEVCSKNLSAA